MSITAILARDAPAAGPLLVVAAGPRCWALASAAVAVLAGLAAATGTRPDQPARPG